MRDGQAAVQKVVTLPLGYRMEWGGEYSQFLEAKSQMYFIGPLAVVLIFMILFALYGNFKFPVTIALGVVMTEPVGAHRVILARRERQKIQFTSQRRSTDRPLTLAHRRPGFSRRAGSSKQVTR